MWVIQYTFLPHGFLPSFLPIHCLGLCHAGSYDRQTPDLKASNPSSMHQWVRNPVLSESTGHGLDSLIFHYVFTRALSQMKCHGCILLVWVRLTECVYMHFENDFPPKMDVGEFFRVWPYIAKMPEEPSVDINARLQRSIRLPDHYKYLDLAISPEVFNLLFFVSMTKCIVT